MPTFARPTKATEAPLMTGGSAITAREFQLRVFYRWVFHRHGCPRSQLRFLRSTELIPLFR